jgi:arylsulfatase A-like enzyme
LLDYLESEGLLDDTLIIYTSDHGELLGDYGAWGKRSLIDAASRIPLLVSYPERFEQGAVAESVCSNVDLLPTILSACGLEAPDDRPGVDLAELASGRAEREGIFCQYQRKARALYGFVSDSFKYIYSVPDEKEWLFRRAEGQPETTNLAGHPVYASILAELRGKLLEEFRRTGYTEPLDGDAFKRYGKLQVPETPDAGQLFQEGRDVAGDFPPGYYVRCNPYQAPPPRFLDFGTKPTGNQ